jgi:hypothetical protein
MLISAMVAGADIQFMVEADEDGAVEEDDSDDDDDDDFDDESGDDDFDDDSDDSDDENTATITIPDEMFTELLVAAASSANKAAATAASEVSFGSDGVPSPQLECAACSAIYFFEQIGSFLRIRVALTRSHTTFR